MGNGGSDSDEEQQTREFGTNFTVNLRNIELTAEQRAEISSEIIELIISKLIEIPDAEELIEVFEKFWELKKWPKYM